jgi:PAS domain S-box-containing protein
MDAAHEDDERFSDVADSAPVLIWMTGPDGLATYFNQPWLSFTGRALHEETGDGWTLNIHPEDRERALSEYHRVFAAREPFTLEYRVRRHDGAYRWMLNTATPRFSDPETFLGYIGACTDTTERKRLERDHGLLLAASRLIESSLDYESTLDGVARLAVPEFADCCVVDLVAEDGPVRGVALAHRDPRAETQMRLLRGRYPPHPDQMDARARRTLGQGRPLVIDDIPDGLLATVIDDPELLQIAREVLPRQLLCVPLRARGVTIGAISFGSLTPSRYSHEDIALGEEIARRCASAIDNARLFREARRQTERLGAIAAAARAFSEAVLDPDSLLETVARRIGTLTGEGCILRLVDGDDDRPATVATWHPAPEARALVNDILVRAGGTASRRLPGHVLQSGEPLVLTSEAGADLRDRVAPEFRPYIDRFGITSLLILPLTVRGRVIGTLSMTREGAATPYSPDDVAFRQSLADRAALAIDNALRYDAERAARAEAEAANRAKDEFLSVLSHELRTPLTPIIGLTQLLLRRPISDPSVGRALETIDRNAHIQVRLVEDLLDVSRIVTGRLQIERRPIDLAPVIEAAIDAVRPTAADKHMRIDINLDPGVPAVDGDPVRLQQVVWNLLSNAVKFTPAGGTVTLTLSRRDAMACIAVSDTGIGIEPEFLPFVFDRFRQADASSTRHHTGLGLGLSIVRHLVEMHGGHVSATSQGPKSGTTFTVLLPLSTPGAGQDDEDLDSSAERPLAGLSVLVLEDDEDTRDLLRLTLELAGARAVVTRSSAEALAALGREQPSLILADIGLPNEDGFAFMRKVRELPVSGGGVTPALALTAYAGSDIGGRAAEAGFQAHLTKPVDPAVLVATLAELAARTRGFPGPPTSAR